VRGGGRAGGREGGRLVDLHATSRATQGGANRCRRLRGNFGGDFGRPPRSSLGRTAEPLHRRQFRKRGMSRGRRESVDSCCWMPFVLLDEPPRIDIADTRRE